MFTHGISIAYFFDLITYIIRKNAQKAGRVLGKTYKIFGNENLERLGEENFKLVVFASFRSKGAASFCSELCRAGDKTSKEFVFENFEYYEKIDEEGEWEDTTIKEKVDVVAAKIVCSGPSSYIARTRDKLRKAGYNDAHLICV